MKEFTMIEKRITEEAEKNTIDTVFYIENGYFPTWAEEHRTDPDRGLKANSTETRWKQYQAGTISREKAVELATKRATKEIEKKTAAKLAKLDRIANAPDLTFIYVSVDWVRSRTWGYNPNVEVRTNTGTYYGTASGCGYDKESAAISYAMNEHPEILKIIYNHAEQGQPFPYAVHIFAGLPSFDGGCGVSCFYHIFEA